MIIIVICVGELWGLYDYMSWFCAKTISSFSSTSFPGAPAKLSLIGRGTGYQQPWFFFSSIFFDDFICI
jgi:hypothetical protein